jgi:predicted dehydrogenase
MFSRYWERFTDREQRKKGKYSEMEEKTRIKTGIIGCGTISDVYMTNISKHYHNLELVWAADLYAEKARQAQQKYGIPCAGTVEELLADPEVELVLDLTIPAAHYSVNRQCLEAGKHVYCEKPLALKFSEAKELTDLAASRGLYCVSAPDTFLGSGIQTVRSIMDSGRIGKAIGFTANMTCPGHELWHPNPGFYYRNGGGPMFDMGPYYLTALVYLLGPIQKISCFSIKGRPVRNILGKQTETEVPTTYTAILSFVCGAVGTMTMSFDTWKTRLPLLEVYGTEGSIEVPDPNGFSGKVEIFDGNKLQETVNAVKDPFPAKLIAMMQNQEACTEEIPSEFAADPDPRGNMRGLGASDLAQALLTKRQPRVSSSVSLHVVEALNAFEISARSGQAYEMTTTAERTEPMQKDWELWEVK